MIHNDGVLKPCLRLALTALLIMPGAAFAQGIPKSEEFIPKSGKGPLVVVISGSSGRLNYWTYAREVSRQGYYTVLIDGKDILTRAQDGAANLRAIIAQAQASRGAPGKVMVIGFSQGGGGVLAHAAAMPELVSAAVAYYPSTSWAARNLPALVGRIEIPVLVLAGERDRYNNCCLIESMREIESLARARQIPLELVVYPNADHGFNLDGQNYRASDTADAWRRVLEMLARHHPIAR